MSRLGNILTIGMGVADKVISKEDKPKIKEHLAQLHKDGEEEMLQQEICKLLELETDVVNQAKDPTWINLLGILGAISIGFNFVGIPTLNFIANVINSFTGPPPIENLALLDLTDIIALLGGLLGMGGLNLASKTKKAA